MTGILVGKMIGNSALIIRQIFGERVRRVEGESFLESDGLISPAANCNSVSPYRAVIHCSPIGEWALA